MTPWPALTEKCFCNSFPLQRRESADTRQICWNGKIGKLEKAFRPVFDLSCFSFLQKPFMKWLFDPWTKNYALTGHQRILQLRKRGLYTNTRASFLFLSVFPHSFRVALCLLVSLIMCESTWNVSVDFWNRVQIAITELLTCFSTGWKPVFHKDLSRALFTRKHSGWDCAWISSNTIKKKNN